MFIVTTKEEIHMAMTKVENLSVVKEEVHKIESILETRKQELLRRAADIGLSETLTNELNPGRSGTPGEERRPLSGGGAVSSAGNSAKSPIPNPRSGERISGSSVSDDGRNGAAMRSGNFVDAQENCVKRPCSSIFIGVFSVLAFALAGFIYAHHIQRSCYVDDFRFTH